MSFNRVANGFSNGSTNSSRSDVNNLYPYANSSYRNRERRPAGYGNFYETPASASSTSLNTSNSGISDAVVSFRAHTRDSDDRGNQWVRSRESLTNIRNMRFENPAYRDRSPARSVTPQARDRGRSQAVDDVLRVIEQDWDFMAGDDCIPVQVSLQLMDSSTLGKADREPDFLCVQRDIQRALRSVVNEHHQSFNSSIGTYHTIQSNIHSSQMRIRAIRSTLVDAKSGLLTTKPELKGLATASQSYDDLLQLFSEIENIQLLPEKIELQISEKRFISAVEILQEALRLTSKTELQNIGALADLRTYFSNQEASLTDVLIEELHDHLYLKSPYCQGRWKPSTGDNNGSGQLRENLTWDRPVFEFLTNLDVNTPLTDDASRNPETDTFYYMQTIIEALNKMGNLEVAVHRIEQRLPIELFSIVNKTAAEVSARNLSQMHPATTRDSKIFSISTGLDNDKVSVLSEFLWELFTKFEAIAEGHRVVHDVIVGIVEREDIKDSAKLTGGFKELWKLYQSEIRSLLHDYLTPDGDLTSRLDGRTLEGGYTRTTILRDRKKKIFKLAELDPNSPQIKVEQEELDDILRSSVPGLMSKSGRKPQPIGRKSRGRQENSGTGHKLLTEPSVFNISLLLPRSVSFIQRLKELVPLNSDLAVSTLTSFLDDFLINVFQPQLEEAITDVCGLNLISSDAFTEDPMWPSVSPRPVFKGAVGFLKIVRMFSEMLDSIPQDSRFTQLVIDQITMFHEKYNTWYQTLVGRMFPQKPNMVKPKTSAVYADSGEFRTVLDDLRISDGAKRQNLINMETDLLMKRAANETFGPIDTLFDSKSVTALSLLYNSTQWLYHNLKCLRRISEDVPETGRSHHWNIPALTRGRNRDSVTQSIYLPLSPDSVLPFDSALESLARIGITALYTLHTDLRCGMIYMIGCGMVGSPNPTAEAISPESTTLAHVLLTEPMTASPAIVDLNNDLIEFDSSISSYLGQPERFFLTSGLAKLADCAVLSGFHSIVAMNNNGALRLQIDVLVLQQNLRNIIVSTSTPEAGSDQKTGSESNGSRQREIISLPRSAKFLDWFFDGPAKALEYARREKEEFDKLGSHALEAGNGEPLTFDDLKVLVELCFSAVLRVPQAADNRETFMAAKRESNDAMLRLSEVMWDS